MLKDDAVARFKSEAETQSLYVSAVSFWETATLHRKNRLHFDPDPDTWWRESGRLWNWLEAPLTGQAALDAGMMNWDHADPADRMIVAQAKALGATLATRDKRLLAYAAENGFEAIKC